MADIAVQDSNPPHPPEVSAVRPTLQPLSTLAIALTAAGLGPFSYAQLNRAARDGLVAVKRNRHTGHYWFDPADLPLIHSQMKTLTDGKGGKASSEPRQPAAEGPKASAFDMTELGTYSVSMPVGLNVRYQALARAFQDIAREEGRKARRNGQKAPTARGMFSALAREALEAYLPTFDARLEAKRRGAA